MGLMSAVRPYEASTEDFERYRQQFIDEVAPLCDGEEVLVAAGFRQEGAFASDKAMDVGNHFGLAFGFLAKKAADTARSHRAGGLPKVVTLAVTPTRIKAFDATYRTSRKRSEREHGEPIEVKSWDRSDVTCTVGSSGRMSNLTIATSAGEKFTLVGSSISDDPWSQEVMHLLAGS